MHNTDHSPDAQALEQQWRASGNYTRLSEGITHWRREGDSNGIPIVLVHGATVPCWEFDLLVPPLLQAGFQTLRFDMFGHGSSDRPRGSYSLERFVRQTEEIIAAADFPRPAILLGHSFGAVVVASVAAGHPQWASRLVLVAPMLNYNSTSSWTRVFRTPGIGELVMHGFGVRALVRRRRRRYQHIGQPHLTERFIEQVEQAGFARGLLSMIRTAALGDQTARYAALRDIDRDILVVTGNDDAVIPPEHITLVRTLLPPHTHCAIKAEHNLLLTHPEEVVAALIRFAK